MHLKRNLKFDNGFPPLLLLPFFSLIFIVAVTFSIAETHFLNKGVPVNFPKTVTSDKITGQNLTVTITGEDVIFLDDKLCTTSELMRRLKLTENTSRSILIKVDRRASVGRIFDVWNSCRKIGIESIHMAATRD